MFRKKEKINTSEIEVDSFMSVIPDNIEQDNRKVMEELLELVLLLKRKYNSLTEIKGRFNILTPDQVSIVLFNSSHGKETALVDAVNSNPISFLTVRGGIVKKEAHMNKLFSNSVVTFARSNISTIIEQLRIRIIDAEQSIRIDALAKW